MPKYRIYVKNISDASHDDPAPGLIKEILHHAQDLKDIEAQLLREMRRQCPDPHQHYSWTIEEIQG